MRHYLLSALLAFVLVLLLASPVRASEWVEGDGYRFRLPEGFERLPADLAGGIPALQTSFGGKAFGGPELDVEMKVFARDWGSTEQGVLAVMRMTLSGEAGKRLERAFDPQTMAQQIQQGLEGRPLGAGGPQLLDVRSTTLGASHEAVELSIQAPDPQLGEQVVRMAFAGYESSVYLFMLSGPEAKAAADDALWHAFTATVRLERVGGLLRLLERWWPLLAGGFLALGLLVVLRRRKDAGPAGRAVRFDPLPTVGARPDGGVSFSRALDGLPTYDEEGGHEPPKPARVVAGGGSWPEARAGSAEADGAADADAPPRGGPPHLGVLEGDGYETAPATPAAPEGAPGRTSRRVVTPARSAPASGGDEPSRGDASEQSPEEDAPKGRFQRNQDFLGA